MWDREGAEKKKEILSYIRLIEISQKRADKIPILC
jgi:hypothetical protein